MSGNEEFRGHAAAQPGDGPSFWQPMPPTAMPNQCCIRGTPNSAMCRGYQTIAVCGHVREHSHADQVELQICFKGKGHVIVDSERHDIVPGTSIFLGHDVKHAIYNDGDEDLVMLWVITPAGLEEFFQTIG